MLPAGFDDDYEDDIELVDDNDENTLIYPSYTYGVDFINGRVVKMIDGTDAMEQAIYKALRTDRFSQEIYHESYGSDVHDLNGTSLAVSAVMIEQYVIDCLLQDNRITDVRDFEVTQGDDIDSVVVSFTVETTEGEVTSELTLGAQDALAM